MVDAPSTPLQSAAASTETTTNVVTPDRSALQSAANTALVFRVSYDIMVDANGGVSVQSAAASTATTIVVIPGGDAESVSLSEEHRLLYDTIVGPPLGTPSPGWSPYQSRTDEMINSVNELGEGCRKMIIAHGRSIQKQEDRQKEWQQEWTKLHLGETKLLLEKQQELKLILEVTKKRLDWLSLLVGLMIVLLLGVILLYLTVILFPSGHGTLAIDNSTNQEVTLWMENTQQQLPSSVEEIQQLLRYFVGQVDSKIASIEEILASLVNKMNHLEATIIRNNATVEDIQWAREYFFSTIAYATEYWFPSSENATTDSV